VSVGYSAPQSSGCSQPDGGAAIEQLGTQFGAALQQNGFHSLLVAGVVRGAQPVLAGGAARP
jgi:hypothetical protein